jgi:MFS family permease
VSPDVVDAQRRFEVREAAHDWNDARIIDDATKLAIDAKYPDDRVRVKPAFRVLLFVFTAFALLASAGLLGVFDVEGSVICLLLGVGAAALTEIQIGPYRRAQGGTEAATSFLAICFLVAFVLLLFEDSGSIRDFFRLTTFLAALLFALACWRWGFALYGGLATALAFAFLALFPNARLSWMLAALVVVPLSFLGSRSSRLAPSHRRACVQALVLATLAFYAAVHLTSYDEGLLEELERPSLSFWREFSVVATAVVPILLLVLGIHGRYKPFLHLGLLLSAASLVTLRYYVHVAPLWVVLLASGGALIGVTLALRHYLRRAPSGERHGFTAEPLYGRAGTELLEMGAAMTTLAPEAVPPREPAFKGGGGEFGGGGASGSY